MLNLLKTSNTTEFYRIIIMKKIFLVVLIYWGISPIIYAEKWVFVPSKENKCNIQIYYDSSALKKKKLIEKWDISQSTDCTATQNEKYLIFESKLDCKKNQLTLISKEVYFKDGSKEKLIYKDKHTSEPIGTPKILMNEACSELLY